MMLIDNNEKNIRLDTFFNRINLLCVHFCCFWCKQHLLAKNQFLIFAMSFSDNKAKSNLLV